MFVPPFRIVLVYFQRRHPVAKLLMNGERPSTSERLKTAFRKSTWQLPLAVCGPRRTTKSRCVSGHGADATTILGIDRIHSPTLQKLVRTAARMSSGIMSKYFVDEMSSVLDDNKKVTHEKLASRVEDKLEDKAFWKKVRGLDSVDIGMADWCYTPIIQSGGSYDLRTSAQSNGNRLEGAEGSGVILASMGLKYKSYCSNIGRTWLVDPHKSQQKYYTFLLELQVEIADKYLRAGSTCKEVYDKAVKYIQAKQPSLVKHFVKNVGFATGLEFRDNTFVLSPKNGRTIQADMTFNLSVGFDGLEDPNKKEKTYSLLIIDTVKTSTGSASFMTERLPSVTESIFFKDEDEDEAVEGTALSSPPKGREEMEGEDELDESEEEPEGEAAVKLYIIRMF